MDRMLSVSEAAEIIGVTAHHIYQMIADRQIAANNLNAGTSKRPHLKIRESAIKDFMDRTVTVPS